MKEKEMIEEMAELMTGCCDCCKFGLCFSKCFSFNTNIVRATILVTNGYTKNNDILKEKEQKSVDN